MTKQQLESAIRTIVRQELSSLIKNPKFIQMISQSILQETLTRQPKPVQQKQKPRPRQSSNMGGDIFSDVNYAAQNNYQTEKNRKSSRVQETLRRKVKEDNLSLESDFWGDELGPAPRRQNMTVPDYIKNDPIMAATANEMRYGGGPRQNTPANDNMILRQVTSGVGFENPDELTDDYRSIDSSVRNAQPLNESYGGNQGSAMSRVSELQNEQFAEMDSGPSVMDLSPAMKSRFAFLNRDYGELI